MKNIKLYENFRPVISYDFDGVLHKSVFGLHPIGMYNFQDWEPFEKMHDQMREDAKNHDIVVVTARSNERYVRQAVESFIELYDLPVSKVYYTDNYPKTEILEEIGAIKHYDDNKQMSAPDGCELIYVNPKLNESVDISMDSYKQDGFVLIYGEKLPDGDKRLYAAQIKKVLSYDRKTKDGPGQAAKMVLLNDDTFRVQIDTSGKMTLVKISNGDKALGILGRKIVLNKNKTPIHWLSTQYTNIGSLISKLNTEIRNIPEIKWYN